MRKEVVVLCMALCALAPANAEVSIGIRLSNVSIGINLPTYPELVRIPGYPVYYAPRLSANFFFYDGLYWVFEGDDWYASAWYNGPWDLVEPAFVPVFILRVPVRYYRRPPPYFHGWQANYPPRWGAHWGHEWSQRRGDWDHWNHRAAPAPAPLPRYQRNYSGERYPDAQRQQELNRQHYRYQPRDPEVRQRFEAQRPQDARDSRRRDTQDVPMQRRPEQRGGERPNAPPNQRSVAPPSTTRSVPPGQAREKNRDKGRGNGSENGRGSGEDHGRGRDR